MTLGDYHAVEVESEPGRKMQASSEYEPNRVLMLLDALLYPVQRDRISPDLNRIRAHWTIEHKTAGNLSYVLISAVLDEDVGYRLSYVFLPSGLLVQSNERALAASWQGHASFAGHVVPGHLMIQAGGRKLLTADITVRDAGQVDPAIFELPGETALPGATLRPLHYFDLRTPEGLQDCSFLDDAKLPVLPLLARGILDRNGVMREVELLDARNVEAATHSKNAANALDCIRGQNVPAATIDKSPGQFAMLFLVKSRFIRR